MFECYIGYVTAVTDEYHAERIKAVISEDKGLPISKIPYSFPLLPKMLHVKPKVGEAVLVLISNDNAPNVQRFYIGPIISQPQKMPYDSMATLSATKLLNGGFSEPENSIDNNPLSKNIFPENDEIAILGRKSSEIIIGDDDIRLRCGVRVTNETESEVTLNGKRNDGEGKLSDSSIRTAPAFIKLKYYEGGIDTEVNPHPTTLSTATVIADKINLISQNGDGGFNLTGEGEGITDEQMKLILQKAHRLPYGDVLCEFLSLFLMMYQAHTHPYSGMPPVSADPDSVNFWTKYSPNKEMLENQLLSKDVRIN